MKQLNTLHIGVSPFMLRAWIAGTAYANSRQAFGSGQHLIKNRVVACRKSSEAAEQAKWAGGFEDILVGDEDKIIAAIQSGNYNAVRIAVPDRDHERYAVPALNAGLVVFLEKGLAHTQQSGANIVRAARSSSGFDVLEYNYNGFAAVRKFRQLIEVGKIVGLNGQAYGAIIRFLQDWGIGDRSNWRFNYELAGLTGVLGDLGTHMIRAILWCLEPLSDPVVAVEGTVTYYDGFGDELRFLDAEDVDPEHRAVDAATFTLITERNARITGETGRHYRFAKADMGMEVFGVPGGKLRWSLGDQTKLFVTEHAGVDGDMRGEKAIHLDDYVPGLSAGFEEGHGHGIFEVLRYLDSGKQGPRPGTSFEQGLHCLDIAAAIRKAGIEHRRVPVEYTTI